MPVQAPAPVHPFNPQSGEVPIDGSVQRANAGFLAPGQSKMAVIVDKVSTTDTTDYIPMPTPQSGKDWVITDMVLTHDQASAQRMALQVNGITVYSTSAHGSAAPDIMNSMETQPDCPGGLQPALVISGAASMHTYANVYGVMQNIGAG